MAGLFSYNTKKNDLPGEVYQTSIQVNKLSKLIESALSGSCFYLQIFPNRNSKPQKVITEQRKVCKIVGIVNL